MKFPTPRAALLGPQKEAKTPTLASRLMSEAKLLGGTSGYDQLANRWWVHLPHRPVPLLFLADSDYPYSSILVAIPSAFNYDDQLGACSALGGAPEGWRLLPLITESLRPGDDIARVHSLARLLMQGVTIFDEESP